METKTGLPATLAGFEDRARFAITVQEQTLGTIDVEWRPDGSFESRSRIAYAGQTLETSLSIVPDEQGRWREIVCQLRAGKLTVTREGSSVTRRFGDRTSTLETPAECLIFDNEAPTLIGQALMRYRRPAGGAQKFPLLLAIKKPVELTLESLGSFEGDPGLTRFRYGVPGLDLYVVADEVCRIYLLEVPAQKTVLVREGFEALLQPQAGRYPLAIVRGAGVPMRDGVELSTDLYLPQGVDQAPVILIRTPYRKEMLELKARTFASRGYVVAVQDCRGCFASPGLWEPLVHEGADGYDAVEWLAAQPYSNGKVGMMGGSYMGWTQWTAAAQNPPHLVTMIPSVSPPDPFYNLPYEYGAFFMMGVLWWIEVVETRAAADLAGTVMYRLADRRYSEMLRALPVIDLDKSVLGGENRYWRKWIEHSTEDEYWQRAGFLDKLEHANLPVFHQSGWFDGDGIGSKLNYLQMVAHGHGFQKLTLGPWGHTDTATRMVLDRDFGENALVDLQGEYLRWFDRWLKDVDNGIERDPLVNLFVMGPTFGRAATLTRWKAPSSDPCIWAAADGWRLRLRRPTRRPTATPTTPAIPRPPSGCLRNPKKIAGGCVPRASATARPPSVIAGWPRAGGTCWCTKPSPWPSRCGSRDRSRRCCTRPRRRAIRIGSSRSRKWTARGRSSSWCRVSSAPASAIP